MTIRDHFGHSALSDQRGLLAARNSDAAPARLHADAGVLIPKDKQAPDPTILSLEEMSRRHHHRQRRRPRLHRPDLPQPHRQHRGRHLPLRAPTGSTVSDFAVWDGAVRIPAVILERKRAEEVYEQARLQAIDPGLLESGERDNTDPKRTALFTAKIVPIPAYGTKRLELEYHQRLAATDFKQFFALPLKPDAGQQQSARTSSCTSSCTPRIPSQTFSAPSKLFPLKLTTSGRPHRRRHLRSRRHSRSTKTSRPPGGSSPDAADKLEVITHRDPTRHCPRPARAKPLQPDARQRPSPASSRRSCSSAIPKPAGPRSPAPRTVILLFDNSLSMQWEKLERSYAALEATLRSLKPADRFNVLLFNQNVTPFKPQPVAADAATHPAGAGLRPRQQAPRRHRSAARPSPPALAQSTQPDTSLVLLHRRRLRPRRDRHPCKIAAHYAARWKQSPHPPHTDIFAVGDDANLAAAAQARAERRLPRAGPLHRAGRLPPRSPSSPSSPTTPSPASALDAAPASQPPSSTHSTTPSTPAPSRSGSASTRPAQTSERSPSAAPATVPHRSQAQTTPLPASDLSPPPASAPLGAGPRRRAARADRPRRRNQPPPSTRSSGSRAATSSSRLTPRFLAVPRSLLRPRVIRPGDPVLRVRTDAAITSVIALFPFGLTKPLRHLAVEDLQRTRRRRQPPLGDALPRPARDEGRHLLRPPDPARHPRQHLQRSQDLRHRQHPAHRQAAAHPHQPASRRDARNPRLRHRHHPHPDRPHLEGVAPVTLRWNATRRHQHRHPHHPARPAHRPLHPHRHRRRHRPQSRQPGGHTSMSSPNLIRLHRDRQHRSSGRGGLFRTAPS